jgi:hypothetical protein
VIQEIDLKNFSRRRDALGQLQIRFRRIGFVGWVVV